MFFARVLVRGADRPCRCRCFPLLQELRRRMMQRMYLHQFCVGAAVAGEGIHDCVLDSK